MKKVYLETPEAVINALKEGKEVFLDEGGAGKVVLIDGFCVKKWNDQFNINYTINLRDKPCILEEEPLKLEVGKFYKTRDGRKVIILSDNYKEKGNSYLVAELGKWTAPYTLSKKGRLFENGLDGWDIVAPWEE